MNKKNLFQFLFFISIVLLLTNIALAKNVEIILDSSNGTSALNIKNLSGTTVATVDSSGNLLIFNKLSVSTTDAASKLTVLGTIETVGTGGIKFSDRTVQITAARNDSGWLKNASKSIVTLEATAYNVAVGTSDAASKLTVLGTIETTGTGGVKFPDGSIQTKAYLGDKSTGWIRSTGKVTLETITDNVGIGTSEPIAKLHVKSGTFEVDDGAVLFSGDNGRTPISGRGARFMWVPYKGALRAGAADGNEWDDANLGYYSFAAGQGTKASSWWTTAFGRGTRAEVQGSTAIGFFTSAEGEYAFATGTNTIAEGSNTVTIGQNFTNSYSNSLGIGDGMLNILLNPSGNSWVNLRNNYGVTYNLAIGTTDATSKLTVLGTIETTGNGGIKFPDRTIQTTAARNNAGWIKSTGKVTLETITDKVGIGNVNPVATFEVAGSVLFSGTTGSTPISGAGTRFMWIPEKSALRAGYVDGTQWNDGNIGLYSTAMGYGTTASINISTAMGYKTIASGGTSTAMGISTTASGVASTAMGESTTASGQGSTAMGGGTIASNYYSTAMGLATKALGFYSTAMGANTTALYTSSIAAGQFLTTEANYTIVLGRGSSDTARLNNNKQDSLMVGFGGTSPILFVSGEANSGIVGIGTTSATSKLTVVGTIETTGTGGVKFPDGTIQITKATNQSGWIRGTGKVALETITDNVGIGVSSPNAKLHVNNGAVLFDNDDGIGAFPVSSSFSRFMWIPSKSAFRVGYTDPSSWSESNIGYCSIAMGRYSIATNETSIAIGDSARSYGKWAVALGEGTEASGMSSTAMGNSTIAKGMTSTALGASTQANGNYSIAMGGASIANGESSFAIGTNVSTDPTARNSFVLGSGVSDTQYLINKKPYSLMVGFGGTSPILFVTGEATNGFVGIGTTDPQAKLTVVSPSNMGAATFGSLNQATGAYSVAMGLNVRNSGTGSLALGNSFTNTYHSSLAIGVDNIDILLNPSGNSWINASDGDLGVGVTNPEAKLHVYSDSAAPFKASTASDNKAFSVASSGKVGIGTSEPASKFQVNGNAAIGYNKNAYVPANGLRVSGEVAIGLKDNELNVTQDSKLRVRGSSASGISRVLVVDTPTSADSLIVDNSGNTGLGGVGVPDTRLHVNGALTLSEVTSTPPLPAQGTEARIYIKNDKFIIAYNYNGTTRYFYINLNSTASGLGFENSTTAP